MTKKFAAGALAVTMALAGCEQMTQTERHIVGGLAGAGVGLVAADMLQANPNWTILAALAGAAAGTMVARNRQTGECAYAVGDGTYRVGPCR
jgi:osmotically inducible lipoprotein OsmB